MLYIMLSATPCGMGKMIRATTAFPFNHVSLTMDSTYRRWYSFARHNKRAPLAGGFVVETPERYAAIGDALPIQLYHIPLSPTQASRVRRILEKAEAHSDLLIYNSFGAAVSVMHFQLSLPGAYTCLDFANYILETNCRSLRELSVHLQPWLHYSGDLFSLIPPGIADPDVFFEKWNAL